MSGIYIIKKHAEMIRSGVKTVLVKARQIPESYLGHPIYLVDKQYVYGIIIVHPNPVRINLTQFVGLTRRHRITNAERLKWWKDYKTLLVYKFDFKPYKILKKI
jgi:hypothetical protein